MDFNCRRRFYALSYTSLVFLYNLPITDASLSVPCQSGWSRSRVSGTCIKAFQEHKTWSQARLKCSSNGGDLVKILDNDMNNFIFGLVKNKKGKFFIGLKRTRIFFTWLNEFSSKATFVKWKPGEPNNGDNSCGVINHAGTNNPRWIDVPCSAKENYICEKNPGKLCPRDWIPSSHSGTCLSVDHSVGKWDKAKEVCAKDGGEVVTIVNNDMNDFIWDQLDDSVSYYIGLNDAGWESKFKWMSHTETVRYTNWDANRDNANTKDCAIINIPSATDKKWRMGSCNSARGVICERFADCSKARYGMVCPKTCRPGCEGSKNSCNRRTGTCDRGCRAGYTGNMCQHECAVGKYGQRCAKSCNSNCLGSDNACDKSTGHCNRGCIAGYEGVKCSIPSLDSDSEFEDDFKASCIFGCSSDSAKHACTKGKYGRNCATPCSANCAGPDNECNRLNGTCTLGCVTGYKGDKCDTPLVEIEKEKFDFKFVFMGGSGLLGILALICCILILPARCKKKYHGEYAHGKASTSGGRSSHTTTSGTGMMNTTKTGSTASSKTKSGTHSTHSGTRSASSKSGGKGKGSKGSRHSAGVASSTTPTLSDFI